MSTAVASPAPTVAASPLSDSLMSMIDQAHAEPVKAEGVESAGVQKPPVSTQPESTPPTGKAAPGKEDKPLTSDAKADDKKADEAKPEKTEAKKEPEPADVFKKRLNEQTAVNSRLGRELKEAQAQIKALRQQMDGTTEQTQAEQEAARAEAFAEFKGKEQVSRKIASEKHGDAFVTSQIYDKDSPYAQLVTEDPTAQYHVEHSDNPVEEALNQLGWHALKKEHGLNHEGFVQSLTEKIRAEVLADIKKQQDDAATLVGKAVPGVGDARGAAEGREAVKVGEEFSLAALGGHFLD